MDSEADDPRLRVLGLLRKYGWNTTSFQVLEPGFCYWFADDSEGAVAYFEEGPWWVAAGAPICEDARLAQVAGDFAATASGHGRRVAFFGAGRRLLQALEAGPRPWDCLLVGLEACWNPTTWTSDPVRKNHVQTQVRRAGRKGVSAREAPAVELQERTPTRAAAEHLVSDWLRGRNMAPLGFLALLDPFSQAQERRYFVAEKEGRLIGLLAAVPVYMRDGWFLEDLLVEARAPNGTSDLLIDTAMRALEAGHFTYASMGMVALAGVGELSTRESGHPILRALLHQCYHSLNWLYGFQGLRSFRSRFKPDMWEPVYLVSYQHITIGTVVAVLQAFAGGHTARFAAHTGRKLMERIAAPVPTWSWWGGCYALSAALVPWIAILLMVDSSRWFGSTWLGAAWASFDVVIAGALAALGLCWRRGWPWARSLNRYVLGAVLADVWMTSAQALLYHGANPTTPLEHLLSGAALSAPYAAAIFLFVMLFARRGK